MKAAGILSNGKLIGNMASHEDQGLQYPENAGSETSGRPALMWRSLALQVVVLQIPILYFPRQSREDHRTLNQDIVGNHQLFHPGPVIEIASPD